VITIFSLVLVKKIESLVVPTGSTLLLLVGIGGKLALPIKLKMYVYFNPESRFRDSILQKQSPIYVKIHVQCNLTVREGIVK